MALAISRLRCWKQPARCSRASTAEACSSTRCFRCAASARRSRSFASSCPRAHNLLVAHPNGAAYTLTAAGCAGCAVDRRAIAAKNHGSGRNPISSRKCLRREWPKYRVGTGGIRSFGSRPASAMGAHRCGDRRRLAADLGPAEPGSANRRVARAAASRRCGRRIRILGPRRFAQSPHDAAEDSNCNRAGIHFLCRAASASIGSSFEVHDSRSENIIAGNRFTRMADRRNWSRGRGRWRCRTRQCWAGVQRAVAASDLGRTRGNHQSAPRPGGGCLAVRNRRARFLRPTCSAPL